MFMEGDKWKHPKDKAIIYEVQNKYYLHTQMGLLNKIQQKTISFIYEVQSNLITGHWSPLLKVPPANLLVLGLSSIWDQISERKGTVSHIFQRVRPS